ncbi:hypothetical protein Tco_0014442 [Tanacetum coccineum]
MKTTKKVWKEKVVASVKPQWKPTGRHFTLYDICPLTRIMEPIVEPLELTPSVSSSSKVTRISRSSTRTASIRKSDTSVLEDLKALSWKTCQEGSLLNLSDHSILGTGVAGVFGGYTVNALIGLEAVDRMSTPTQCCDMGSDGYAYPMYDMFGIVDPNMQNEVWSWKIVYIMGPYQLVHVKFGISSWRGSRVEERQEVWNDCKSCKVRVGSNGNLLWEASVLLGRKVHEDDVAKTVFRMRNGHVEVYGYAFWVNQCTSGFHGVNEPGSDLHLERCKGPWLLKRRIRQSLLSILERYDVVWF